MGSGAVLQSFHSNDKNVTLLGFFWFIGSGLVRLKCPNNLLVGGVQLVVTDHIQG